MGCVACDITGLVLGTATASAYVRQFGGMIHAALAGIALARRGRIAEANVVAVGPTDPEFGNRAATVRFVADTGAMITTRVDVPAGRLPRAVPADARLVVRYDPERPGTAAPESGRNGAVHDAVTTVAACASYRFWRW
jgi:hypothetical protein